MVLAVHKTRVRLRSEQAWEIISGRWPVLMPQWKIYSLPSARGSEDCWELGPLEKYLMLFANRCCLRYEYCNEFLDEILKGRVVWRCEMTNSRRKNCTATHLDWGQRKNLDNLFPFYSDIWPLAGTMGGSYWDWVWLVESLWSSVWPRWQMQSFFPFIKGPENGWITCM